MKIKTSKLEWYVLNWNNNEKKMKPINILSGVAEDLAKEVKSGSVHNKSILREYIKTYLMYNYWSKVEYEFFASDMCGMNYEKISAWQQIEPNLDIIVDYINKKCDLNFK